MSSDATSLPALTSLPAAAAPPPGRTRPGAGGPSDPGGADRSRRFRDALDQASRPASGPDRTDRPDRPDRTDRPDRPGTADRTGRPGSDPGAERDAARARRAEHGRRPTGPQGPHRLRRDAGPSTDAPPNGERTAGSPDVDRPASSRPDDTAAAEPATTPSVADPTVTAALTAASGVAAPPPDATPDPGAGGDLAVPVDNGQRPVTDLGAAAPGDGTGPAGGADAPALSPAVQPGATPLPGTPGGTGAPATATTPAGPETDPATGTGPGAVTDPTPGPDPGASPTGPGAAGASGMSDSDLAGDSSGGSADTTGDTAASPDSAATGPDRTAGGADRPANPTGPAGGPLSALAAAAAASSAAPTPPATPAGRAPAGAGDRVDGAGGSGSKPGPGERAEADANRLDGRLAAAFNGDQGTAPAPTSSSAPAAGATRSTGADPLWRQVQRALHAVRLTAEGNHEMTIRLRPDHLGSLTVKVTTGEAGTTVALVAESRAAAQQLEQQRHLLADELSGGGLRGAAIDIGLGSGTSSGSASGSASGAASGGSRGRDGAGPATPVAGRSGLLSTDNRLDAGRAEALRAAARRRSAATVDLAL